MCSTVNTSKIAWVKISMTDCKQNWNISWLFQWLGMFWKLVVRSEYPFKMRYEGLLSGIRAFQRQVWNRSSPEEMKLQSRVPKLFPYSIFQTNVAYMEIYHDKYTEIRFLRAYIPSSIQKRKMDERRQSKKAVSFSL